MALLPPWMLDTVVAIGTEKVGVITAIATGFLAGWSLNAKKDGKDAYSIHLVTNRHVLQEKATVHLRFNQGSTGNWHETDLTDEEDKPLWHAHSDSKFDLAALGIDVRALEASGADFRYFAMDRHAAYSSTVREHGIAQGDKVFVLGFPMGLAGTAKSYVIVRGGTVARWDDEIVDETGAFLIDASVFPGNSGGPVVIEPSVASIKGTEPVEKALLVGVVSGYLPYQDVAISQQTGEPRVIYVENSGLASVVPLDYIQEFMEPLIERDRAELLERGLIKDDDS